MKRRVPLTSLMVLVGMVMSMHVVTLAQDETLPELAYFQPESGQITGQEDTSAWQFFAFQNEMMTLWVKGGEDFDPVLTLSDDQGISIVSNDDYDYPASRDALLEGITIPRNGIYRVEVSGYAGSSGSFVITRQPGYGALVLGPGLADLEWEPSERVIHYTGTEGVSLEVIGARARGYIVNMTGGIYEDAYVEINIPQIEGVGGWIVGLVLKWQSDENFYSAEVSSQGVWRLVLLEDGVERTLRDWTAHPGLQGSQTSFRIGVLMRDGGFEIFVNGQIVGQARDSRITEGRVGAVVVTSDVVGSRTRAFIDELSVTLPVEVSGGTIFPGQLVIGNANQVIHELERRGVISPGGSMVLTVAESFIERRSDGVDVLSLGRGALYRDFVLATTVTLEQAETRLAGCGLMIRWTGSENYMVAYKDVAGGYGISERQGTVFAPGLFGENPKWAGIDRDQLLVVALGAEVHFFINGFHVGSVEAPSIEAVVGNAILNFEPVNSVCRFTDTWLWRAN